ncbi:MAG TPA: hypothetical protein PK184_12000 [Phycisphaerae bacterium]|nr:hypothetical protein [Phycisphaerae bacterium]
MIEWEQVWKYVVWAAIISYFGLGLAITFGGFFDAIKMFRRLEAEHAEDQMANSQSPMSRE